LIEKRPFFWFKIDDFFQKMSEKIAQIGEFVHEFNKLQQIFTKNALTFLHISTKKRHFPF